jgi:carbonic anhydrase/acetyltransferase-like protein (isoleucine patch superfamily)
VAIENFERFVPHVAPDAFVHPAATVIGEVELGAEASVWPSAALRGDHGAIRVGARTSVQDGTVAHATENVSQVLVGSECTVGHRAVLHGCRVGDHCLVGMGSILLDNVELGEWCFVGAGTLLTPGKTFPAGSFILGSPGRRIRDVTSQEKEWIVYSWKAYLDLTRRYRARGG